MKILRKLYQVGHLGSGVFVSQAVIMIESGVCFRCMCEDFHWVHIWVPYGSLQFHTGQQKKVCASVCLQVTQAFTLSAGIPGSNNACEPVRAHDKWLLCHLFFGRVRYPCDQMFSNCDVDISQLHTHDDE